LVFRLHRPVMFSMPIKRTDAAYRVPVIPTTPRRRAASGIRTGAIAAGCAKHSMKPRVRPGSCTFSATKSRPPMERTKGKTAQCVFRARRATILPSGLPHGCAPPGDLASEGWGTGLMPNRRYGVTLRAEGFTQQRIGVLKRTHQAMRWLTIRLRRHQYHRQVVPGAAVGDLDHFGDTAHPTQSGLERDNTPADCKSRRAAPPCPAWPASRGARAHRADFSWTAHFQGLHGYTADICQLSIHGRVSAEPAAPEFTHKG
jgi:hypothetical protein